MHETSCWIGSVSVIVGMNASVQQERSRMDAACCCGDEKREDFKLWVVLGIKLFPGLCSRTNQSTFLADNAQHCTQNNGNNTTASVQVTMSAIAKAFDPLLKVAARFYQGALTTELNKMGECRMLLK